MEREITGFHLDEEGHWVAELSCLHNQHVRNRPPFQERSWVVTEEGRAARIGSALECPLCDRAEPPADLTISRTAGPFDRRTVPNGLLRAHRLARGVWGRLQVHSGSVGIRVPEEAAADMVDAGQCRYIPPEVPHRLDVGADFELTLDFLVSSSDTTERTR